VTLSAPVALTTQHGLEDFDCGVPMLNDWLVRRALNNQDNGASRTFVACERQRVIAYYALAMGAAELTAASGRFRRNMPDPIPVAVLGRLAVDHGFRGQGLGQFMLRDAALRVMGAAEIIGVRGMLVHAVSEAAKHFYIRCGFEEAPDQSMTLMATLADLRRNLTAN